MPGDLLGLGYPMLLVAALTAAIVQRRRLGAAARPAIGGFALLLTVHALGELSASLGHFELTRPENGLPGLADLPAALVAVDLVLGIAELAGTALLIAAVVRRGARGDRPEPSRAVPAAGGEAG